MDILISQEYSFVCAIQDPPYSTGTEPEFDVDLEPKLDDSVLQWDDELDENDTLTTIDVSPREPRIPVSATFIACYRKSHFVNPRLVYMYSSIVLLSSSLKLMKND